MTIAPTNSLLQEALVLHRQGALAEAVRRYYEVLRSDPANSDALYYLAMASFQQGQLDEAIDLARRAAAGGQARTHHLLGVALHRLGRREDALASFEDAIAAQPDFADAHGGRANVLSELGRLDEAVESYDRALALRPDSLPDLCNCGATLHQLGRYDEAIKHFDRAIALKPDFAEIHCNRANSLARLERYEEARAGYDRALANNPRLTGALTGRGDALRRLGRVEDAVASYQKALALQPDLAEAHMSLGNALQALDRHDQAIACYQRALAANPTYAEAHANLAGALAAQNRHAEAIAHCERALALKPDLAEAHINLGNALHALDRYAEALQHCEKAVALKPDFAEAHMNLGNPLQALNRYEEAIVHYRKALTLKPELAAAHCSLGFALQAIERDEEALAHYDQALALKPDFAAAKWNKSLFCLSRGRLAEGWPLHEHRWVAVGERTPRAYPQPRWNGGYVDGALLVWGEQGLGDQILYAGMVQELQERARSVLLEVEPRLVPLFARSFPGVRVLALGPALYAGPIDVHEPLVDLGKYLRPTWDAFPQRQYLRADATLSMRLRERLTADGKRVIGLSWRSTNPAFGRSKTAALSDFESVLRLPDCRYVDLQYGDTSAERNEVGRQLGVEIVRLDDVDNTNDIDALAALITACDAVVTVSNTTAHLAGALGKSTWVMAPHRHGRLWYWFKDRANSPWYPRVQVRRQAGGQSWRQLLSAVSDEVSAHLASQ